MRFFLQVLSSLNVYTGPAVSRTKLQKKKKTDVSLIDPAEQIYQTRRFQRVFSSNEQEKNDVSLFYLAKSDR